eukprot:g5331.t1
MISYGVGTMALFLGELFDYFARQRKREMMAVEILGPKQAQVTRGFLYPLRQAITYIVPLFSKSDYFDDLLNIIFELSTLVFLWLIFGAIMGEIEARKLKRRMSKIQSKLKQKALKVHGELKRSRMGRKMSGGLKKIGAHRIGDQLSSRSHALKHAIVTGSKKIRRHFSDEDTTNHTSTASSRVRTLNAIADGYLENDSERCRHLNCCRRVCTTQFLFSCRRPKAMSPLLFYSAFLFFYITVGAAIFYALEPDTFGNFGNCVYFVIISLTTIGYGDFSPTTRICRIFFVLYGSAGISLMASVLAKEESSIKDQRNKLRLYRYLKDRVDFLSDEGFLVAVCGVQTLMTFIVGSALFMLFECVVGKSGHECGVYASDEVVVNLIYFSTVSMTTVGYGDAGYVPTTMAGKAEVSLYALIGLVNMAMTVKAIVNFVSERSRKRREAMKLIADKKTGFVEIDKIFSDRGFDNKKVETSDLLVEVLTDHELRRGDGEGG